MYSAPDLIRAGIETQVRKSLADPRRNLATAASKGQDTEKALDDVLTAMSETIYQCIVESHRIMDAGGNNRARRRVASEWGVPDQVLGEYPPQD